MSGGCCCLCNRCWSLLIWFPLQPGGQQRHNCHAAGVWGKVLGQALMGAVPESVISMVSLRGWVSSAGLLPLGVPWRVCACSRCMMHTVSCLHLGVGAWDD